LNTHNDPVLATLWLPFAEAQLHWPVSDALFLNARAPLPAWTTSATSSLTCVQSFKPEAAQLEQQGVRCAEESASLPLQHFAVALLLPPRQREHARALLARAVMSTQAGGHVVLAAANNEGARSVEKDLEQLTGKAHSLSKHKCRVCWNVIDSAALNMQLLNEWQQLDALRPIEDGRFVSRPGVFAWDRIDVASKLLVEQLPNNLRGRGADLGAGFGYLSVELLQRCKGITHLDVYEADARALQLAKLNINTGIPASFHWHDVTQGLTGKYDVIVTNPPFHAQTRHDRPDIGQQFIRAAAAALKARGQLWLVANRHLPYEDVLNASFGPVRIATEQHGFKIIHAIKSD
jgi:16S rRNA (guanine1207-N2)-methyltransferase